MPSLSEQIARDIREGTFPKKSSATLTEERTWKCSGCGKLAPDREVNCECATGVLFRQQNGTVEHAIKLDPLHSRVDGATDAEQAAYWKACFERMSARNVVLSEALKPFADIGISSGPDSDTVRQVIEIGTVRKAREVLEQKLFA